jgi:hydroxymethylglutaryl-CoA reductase (NADPH)
LFEESRRARVDGHATARDLPLLGAQTRALDTALIGRYFDDFVAQRVVPDTPRRPRTVATTLDVSSFVEPLSQLLNAPIQVEDIALTPFTTDGSIIAELTTHRAGATGLFDARVSVATAAGSRCDLRVFVKAKSEDACTIDVAEALGALASPTLGETVKRFRVDLGLTRSHLRELAVYALENDALRRHMPRALLIERDDARDRWLLGLEWIDDAILMNATDASQWSSDAIDAAVTGLAQIHSAFFGRVAGLAEQPWLAPRRDRAKRVEMTPLWAALASHAHDHSAAWSDARVRRIHQRLVGDVGSWAHALDGATHTLIHNDFNPRNIAIRAGSGALQLCAFDWELAAIGAPQRDLAELLCFVLPPNASLATIAHWIDRHRVELAKHTATEISRSDWETGFSAALCDFLVDRLAMYAMVDRVRPQRFVPRVVRSWLNIFRHYPWVG